jgi:hypothetical protein
MSERITKPRRTWYEAGKERTWQILSEQELWRLSRNIKPEQEKDPRVTWNGVTYADLASAAAAIQVNESTLRWRLNQGHNKDSDLKQSKKA